MNIIKESMDNMWNAVRMSFGRLTHRRRFKPVRLS